MSSTSSRRCSLAVAGAAALLAACAGVPSRPPPPALPPGLAAVELTATPFFPQTAYQCGPAALATVLGASGIAADPDVLATQVYIPDRRGSLQVELGAAARRAGRVPWPLDGGLAALARELTAGNPVLVLQDVGRLGIRRWHYAVAVGIDPARPAIVLRSGRTERLAVPVADFARSWSTGGHWGLVVLAPGSLPASLTPARAVATLADAEGLLPAPALAATWAAAAERWPDEVTVRFGAANAARGGGDARAAEAGYRAILARDPGHLAALNNLADLLLDAGCADEGRDLAGQAHAASRAPGVPAGFRAAIDDTWRRARACAGEQPAPAGVSGRGP